MNVLLQLETFNIPLSDVDRSSRQKISKDITELNSIIDQLDIIDIYRALHQQQQNTYSSQAHIEHSPQQTHCEPTHIEGNSQSWRNDTTLQDLLQSYSNPGREGHAGEKTDRSEKGQRSQEKIHINTVTWSLTKEPK